MIASKEIWELGFMVNCNQKHLCQSMLTGLGLLGLRLFLAYEFFQAGLKKWRGENWFGEIQHQFPFPFDALPANFNWGLAMGAELLLPVLLLLGLLTRVSAAALSILTAVAWFAVHAGAGYNVCQNGYKMALIYLIMLLPLMMQGAGIWSLDFLVRKYFSAKQG